MSIFDFQVQTTTIHQFTAADAQRLEAAFNETLNAVAEAKAALDRAARAAKIVGGFTAFRLERADESDIAEAFWTAALRSLPVYRVMSHQDRETVERWVGSHEYHSRGTYSRWFPPFTVAEIMQVAEKYENRHAYFLRNWALTVYRNFVGRPEDEGVHIPNKIKVRGYVGSQGVEYGWKLRNLADLDRLFHYLDGRPLEEPFSPYEAPLITAIREAVEEGKTASETDFFKFRFYTGNGNLDLTFKRHGLVADWEQLARQRFHNQAGI